MALIGNPSMSLTYVNDGNIQCVINESHPNGFEAATSFYVSRWNQADNTWGGETRVDAYSPGPNGYVGIVPGAGTTSNRKYRWRVRGKNANGYSVYGYTDYLQTSPYAPSGASAWVSGPGTINLSWSDNAYAPYYDYNTQIWWNINGGGWGHWTTVGAGTTSASLSVTPGATYQFQIRHVETYGAPELASGWSTTGVVTALSTPNTPGALSATRNSDTSVSLSWSNDVASGRPYDSLTLQRWDSVGNTWTTLTNLSGSTTSITDTGTVAGRKYQYRIAANNSTGSSGWSTSGAVYMTPSAPSNVDALYTGGTSIGVSWSNNSSYSEYSLRVQPYKNGAADGSAVSLSSGVTSYTKTGVDITATYYFKVWAVSDTGALASTQTQSNSVMAATPPNAPTNLAGSASVIDKAKTHSISWVHSPSIDGSAQTKYQIRHRVNGTSTWTENAVVTSTASTASNPFSSYTNGQVIEWQVRTYGVHANPGPYSASATQQTSTTPTVTITSPGASITMSRIDVAWSYFDAESTPQTEWAVDLIDTATGTTLEQQSGADATASVTMSHAAEDGLSYTVKVKVRDTSGLWSDQAVRTFDAAFIPPAEVLLQATMDPNSGAVVLNLTPTADDGGVTTFPASGVTIERQIWDYEIEDYGEWEPLLTNVPVDAVFIDTTAPIHDDGHYRITTHSAAPSIYRPATYVKPDLAEERWVYVSGGDQFDVICRMWANIELEWSASRNSQLHYFAERRRPVLYSGEATEKVLKVTGLLDDESSSPQQWLRLARQPGPVLLRGPKQPRIYGNLSEVNITRIHKGLHKVSFSIQQVGK